MPRESASLRTTAPSPRSAMTPSASSQGESHFARWKPASTKTPTASSSSCSVVPPTMTRVTAATLASQGLFQPLGKALRDAERDDLLHRGVANRRLRAARREDLLALLGQREGRDVRVAGRLEHLERGA